MADVWCQSELKLTESLRHFNMVDLQHHPVILPLSMDTTIFVKWAPLIGWLNLISPLLKKTRIINGKTDHFYNIPKLATVEKHWQNMTAHHLDTPVCGFGQVIAFNGSTYAEYAELMKDYPKMTADISKA